ncbi:MAG: hypothetical protein JF600_06225 [Xanthomonadales bacterium]|nr:hypothetical protein [Xanthomonadales bacterium]
MSPRTSLSLALLACLSALPILAASAQDRAMVGGGGDPALVGGGGWAPAAPAASAAYGGQDAGPAASLTGGFGGEMGGGPTSSQRAADEVQALLGLVQGQMDGSATSGNAMTDRATAARYRADAEELVRRYWDRLSPVTRDLYSSSYGTRHPDAKEERYRSPYGDNGQIEDQMLGGTRDAAQAMQGLEDLLLPMLGDMKRGFDAELRNRSRR